MQCPLLFSRCNSREAKELELKLAYILHHAGSVHALCSIRDLSATPVPSSLPDAREHAYLALHKWRV